MIRFLIISADGASGRGTRGLNLYWFLSRFHGRAVRIVSTTRLAAGGGGSTRCDTLFLGLPTELTRETLRGVRYRQLVLFDYQDSPAIQLDREHAFLAALTDRYLKVWNEPGWTVPWRFGVLPIRRQMRLPLYLRYLRLARAFGRRPPERTWDVSFLGSGSGQEVRSQRVEWLRQIRREGGHLRFWGGLAAPEAYRRHLEASGVDPAGLVYEGGRVGFHTFFEAMRRSKTVLAPMGNARWSYRHYEAIYAGAILVSCDMRHARTLLPLPLETMIHVPDGEPVLEYVEQGLRLGERMPDVREANVAFLERFLQYGDYSRRKPELMERFLAQLSA